MQINTMGDREAMGLAESYTDALFTGLNSLYQHFAPMTVQELLGLLVDDMRLIQERFVAGQLLALYGDPRVNTYSPVMIDIPGGSVEMGVDSLELDEVLSVYKNVGVIRDWLLKETPAHQVRVANFRIRKYLVTNQEYKDFLQASGFAEIPTSWEFGFYPCHKANHPVYTVTDVAAEAYASWISSKTGRRFRLPTEAEWEYAASGPKHCQYPWGDDYQPGLANTIEERIYRTTPVGLFAEGDSYFGLSDMAGNVEEYVADYYTPYPGGPAIKDDLTQQGCYRVARGGSFTRYADLARTTRRHGRYPKGIYVMGFRLVEEV